MALVTGSPATGSTVNDSSSRQATSAWAGRERRVPHGLAGLLRCPVGTGRDGTQPLRPGVDVLVPVLDQPVGAEHRLAALGRFGLHRPEQPTRARRSPASPSGPSGRRAARLAPRDPVGRGEGHAAEPEGRGRRTRRCRRGRRPRARGVRRGWGTAPGHRVVAGARTGGPDDAGVRLTAVHRPALAALQAAHRVVEAGEEFVGRGPGKPVADGPSGPGRRRARWSCRPRTASR